MTNETRQEATLKATLLQVCKASGLSRQAMQQSTRCHKRTKDHEGLQRPRRKKERDTP